YVMLGYNVFAADTDAEAQYLASSWQQSFVSLRSGRPIRLPPPVEGYTETLPPAARAMLDTVLSCAAVGSPDTVKHTMLEFIARTQADELIITCNTFDHQARLRSYELVAGLRSALGPDLNHERYAYHRIPDYSTFAANRSTRRAGGAPSRRSPTPAGQ